MGVAMQIIRRILASLRDMLAGLSFKKPKAKRRTLSFQTPRKSKFGFRLPALAMFANVRLPDFKRLPALGDLGKLLRSLRFSTVFRSLKTWAAIFIIFTITVPLTAVGWYFTNLTMESLTKAALERNDKVAERIASDIGNYMLAKKNFLMVTSARDELRSLQPEAISRLLGEVKPYYGGNDALFFAKMDGQQIARTDGAPGVNIADRSYFQAALQGNLNFSEPLSSKINKQLTILGAVPVSGSDGKVAGVLGSTISLTNINFMIEHILSQNPGYIVTVIDQNRIPLFYQSDEAAVTERRELTEDYYRQAVQDQTGSVIGQFRSQNYLISFRPVANTNWTVLTLFPQKSALATAYEMVDNSVKFTLALIALLVIVGLYAVHRALLPLGDMVSGVSLVAQGNLTHHIQSSRKDEFGRVAAAFNSMTQNLRDIVFSVKQTSTTVLDSSSAMVAAADQSSKGTQQVTQSIQSIVEKMQLQGQNTATTEKLLQQLVETSRGVSGSVQHAAQSAAECTETAEKGQAVVTQTVEEMNYLKQTMAGAVRRVEELGISVKEIGTITAAITAIASQTNLLALNAAIEAARAGDAGRGFAVVAQEVRKLAEQAAGSANSISRITRKLGIDMEEAVGAMHDSSTHVDKGVQTAQEMGTAFNQIVTAIEQVYQQTGKIADETQKQVMLCQNAMEAVGGIHELAEQNAMSTQEIASVSLQQSAAAEEISGLIHQLRDTADELEGKVAEFQI